MPQDAAGDWINSSGCQGNIQLEGMVGGQPFGGAAFFCIRNRPLDAPRQHQLDTTGVIWGQTRIRRFGGYELNIHQFCGWNNFPQCFDYAGAQSMTVVPIARSLTITAVPNTGFVAGDTITFTATSPHPRTVRQWRWIPADSGQPVQVITQCGTNPTCRVRIPGDGLMIVRARVVPWGQLNRIETAHARVTAPRPRLIVEVDERSVGAGDTVLFTLRSDPVRPIAQPIWSAVAALRAPDGSFGFRSEEFEEAGTRAGMAISGCQPGSPFCEWQVMAPTRKQVEALVNGVSVTGEAKVDTVPCPTKDSILDDPVVRELLRDLINAPESTNPVTGLRRELSGYVIDSAGIRMKRINPIDPALDPCSSPAPQPILPPGVRMVARIHTHPFKPYSKSAFTNDTLPDACKEPGQTGQSFLDGDAFGGFSGADWSVAKSDLDFYGYPVAGVAIDAHNVFRLYPHDVGVEPVTGKPVPLPGWKDKALKKSRTKYKFGIVPVCSIP
jgi:hypothetical protein